MESTDARARLLELLPPGTPVYTILRHVSSSGMSRDISAMIVRDGRPFLLDGLILAADLGFRRSRRRYGEGLAMGGYGMDMGFSLVYSLSSSLYRDGHACTGKQSGPGRCPSNDHTNDYGRLTAEWNRKHGLENTFDRLNMTDEQVAERQEWISSRRTYRKNRMHRDGGYALNQRWL
jgi:hypothetical protein